MTEITRTTAADLIPTVWDSAMMQAWPEYAMARALGMTVEEYFAQFMAEDRCSECGHSYDV